MKVINLPGITQPDHSIDQQPQPEIVEWLESLLADAKQGKIHAIAIAMVRDGGVHRHGWQFGDLDRGHTHAMVAVVNYLHHEIVRVALDRNSKSYEDGAS